MENTLRQKIGVSWKLTINLDFHYMSNSTRWVGMDGFQMLKKKGDGRNTRRRNKSCMKRVLLKALAKLTLWRLMDAAKPKTEPNFSDFSGIA